MATVRDLNVSILLLSPQEQIDLIKKTRLSRRTSKFTRKQSKQKTPKKKQTLKELVGGMSEKQKAFLRAQILGS